MAETIKQNTGKINCQWFYDLLVNAYLNGKDLADKHLVVTKKQWGRWINEKKEINCTERNLAGFVNLMNKHIFHNSYIFNFNMLIIW